jgi:phosphate transport system substrate-binding protein
MWALFLGGLQEDLLGIAVNADPGLLQAVISDPLGIGYNNLGYAFDITTGNPVVGAVVVPIDLNENGIADPEEYLETMPEAMDAVVSGAYPAPPARMLFLAAVCQRCRIRSANPGTNPGISGPDQIIFYTWM